MTTTTTTRTFPASPGTGLWLRDLPGTVRVLPADTDRAADTITVTVTGTEAARDEVTVTARPGMVTVSGPAPTALTTVTTLRGGSISIQQSADVIGPGQSVIGAHITGSGNVVIGGAVGGRVIVNGVDVTDHVTGRDPGTVPHEPAEVTVTVPTGTAVTVRDCQHTTVTDVAGLVDVEVCGEREFTAHGATEAEVQLSGQCTARLLEGTGEITVDASGQCRTEVHGHHERLRVDLAGQSSVVGSGAFARVTGGLSGMSSADLTGDIGRTSVHTRGMSRMLVNGRVVGR